MFNALLPLADGTGFVCGQTLGNTGFYIWCAYKWTGEFITHTIINISTQQAVILPTED